MAAQSRGLTWQRLPATTPALRKFRRRAHRLFAEDLEIRRAIPGVRAPHTGQVIARSGIADFPAFSVRGELAWPERAEADAAAIEFFIGRSCGNLHFVVADRPDRVTAKSVAPEFAGGMSVENADFAAVIKRIRGNQRASGDVFAVHEILCVSGS